MKTSFVINYFRVPKAVFNHIYDVLLSEFDQNTKQFFCHILYNTNLLTNRDEEGWVPFPYKTIKQEWGRDFPDIEELINSGLIEVKQFDINGAQFEYSQFYKRCREYRVPLYILENINSYYPSELEGWKQIYNLMTGKISKKSNKTKYYDHNRNPYPQLIKDSMKTLRDNGVYFNKEQIDRFLSQSKAAVEAGELNPHRYQQDLNAYHNILQADIVTTEHSSIYKYTPVHSPQLTGRLSEHGIGLQSCTREMKEAAFTGIPNLYNYDLKSSQIYGLIQWLEYAHIDTSWLTTYLESSKPTYADQVGISVDTWKHCLMALIMGANLTSTVKDNDNSISRALLNEFNGDKDLANKAAAELFTVLSPLKKVLNHWVDWLLDTYIPMNSVYPRGSQILINKAAMTLTLDDYKDKKGSWTPELKRKLPAFLLQGNEAAFIHHLTVISSNHNYQVISNQHDGVVTIGEIPPEAIEYAKTQSGLKYAQLELKSFV
ncbi:hypothetical protein [Picosynechococcus sp. PCC 7117]|uniref:hypothetical protein n=1 Tax=Picosynechococcus sp. PCC 7117 TaxID=195498 RepID=UPI0012EDF143|nr:hypothetical protein [Picosynechococcus sp. PCC 7117]